MNKMKLSIEELIFSFYNEGFYEQGIGLKEVYYSEISDAELRFLFEITTRSMLAKDMLEYKEGKYTLKDQYKKLITVINRASATVKLSKFSTGMNGEETTSIHLVGNTQFIHNLENDNQVHVIEQVADKNMTELIESFYNIKASEEIKVMSTLTDNDFEALLKDLLENEYSVEQLLSKWDIDPIFINDIFERRGKMDSIMIFSYDQNNSPVLEDLRFIIPGKSINWIITRKDNLLSIQPVSRTSLLIETPQDALV